MVDRRKALKVVAGVTGAAAIGWIAAGALALSANADFDATVGEICDALRAVFGEAKSPTL